MIRALSIAAAIAVGIATVAVAQDSPIEKRQASMKAMSAANKGPGQMLKGERPFDLAVVKAALSTLADEAKKSKDLYPAGSDQGKTRALPDIWKNSADFQAKFDKFAAAAQNASAAITDEASFKKEFPGVVKNCGGCHKPYRAPN
jgi:cytochrome c556